ncbi:MAG: NAD-dependent malic enzyme [Chloroflexi bacterium]|nr:NAD-dependent malic enzyme [Chloroflexota bacterium]
MHKASNYTIARTLRCRNANMPGTLGKLTSAIGQRGADIGNITTAHVGHEFTVRDIEIFLDSQEHLEAIEKAIAGVPGVTLLEVRDEVLDLHRNGKIRMINTVPINSLDVLRRIYTPGVAEVCQLIATHPEAKNSYTSIARSVAIVTDGTAILGLGNIGPVAGMPVMEGKAALLQHLVGISGIPILVNTQDTAEIVRTVKHIAPTFGGIHIEDIASPRCFDVETMLQQELDIPVMHDDQRATAVVTLAALLNACQQTGKDLRNSRVGVIGLGAAGLTIAEFVKDYTGNPVLGSARTEATVKRHVDRGGTGSSLEEIMSECDIVVATSGVRRLIKPEMVRRGQIIFALTNPYPEIDPEEARKAGAALAGDGRTINNLLAYPGIWRGTLDAGATRITFEMYREAALAIASTIRNGELVPNPLSCKVHLAVAHAVARAAMDSGVARRKLGKDYFDNQDVKADWAGSV